MLAEVIHEWAFTALTVVASTLFVVVGLTLRRYAANHDRLRLAASGVTVRPSRRSRRLQLANFGRLAHGLLADYGSLVGDQRPSDELKTLTPLVSEARKKGEYLLQKRTALHRFLQTRQERALEPLLERLTSLEKALKSLPRSKLTVEDVLAGRFEKQNPADKGV